MKMNKKTVFMILGIVIVGLALTGCANSTNVQECIPSDGHTYGFWAGTWHGIISGPAFICSLIWDDISVYAINNNGGWYDFGFVGGLFTILKLIGLSNKK